MPVIPEISLCMIVRNEEKQLRRCLESAKAFVSEILLVDTGSIDETKEIAQEYGAKVMEAEWAGDFASVRNLSIREAQGEWILWLDADEAIEINDLSCLWKAVSMCDVVSVPIVNYFGEKEPVQKGDAYVHYQYRFFRNRVGILFEWAVHESLAIKDTHKIKILTQKDGVIHHYGYLEERVKEKKKSRRNLDILTSSLRENSQDPWLLFYLANELASLKEYPLAFQSGNAAILAFVQQGLLPPAILYRLKYEILFHSQKYEEIIRAIDSALQLYPNYTDLIYVKGLAYLKMRRYDLAARCFKACLDEGEEKPEYIVLRGCGSFRAHAQLNTCLRALGMIMH